MWYIHAIEYYSAFKKEGNPIITTTLINLKDVVKWNKLVTKGQILWVHVCEVTVVVKLTETESRSMVVRLWRKGETGTCCSMGIKFQLYKVKKSARELLYNTEHIVNTVPCI